MNVTPRVFFIALCVTLIHVSCSSIRITAPVIEFACDKFSATLTCPVADNSSSVVWHRLVHGNWLPLQVGRLGRNSWKPVVGDMSKISTRSVNTHMAGKYRCSYPSGAIIHEVELRVDVCNGQVGDCTAKPVLGDFENFKNRKIVISRRHGESVAFKCSTLNDWFCLNSDCSQCSSAKADDSSSPSVVSSSFRFKWVAFDAKTKNVRFWMDSIYTNSIDYSSSEVTLHNLKRSDSAIYTCFLPNYYDRKTVDPALLRFEYVLTVT